MRKPTAAEPRWRRMPEERPQQIIHAALEEFAQHGLDGAKLDDIAQRAGVSKGTIYLYFPNKEELFREMIRSTVVAELVKAERLPPANSAASQLTGFLEGYWRFLRTPAFATIYALVLGELHNFPDLAEFYTREVVMRASRLVSGIIQRGIDTGEFRKVDPLVAARMMAALFSTTALWCARKQRFPSLAGRSDKRVFTELCDFYMHSIRA